MTIGSIHFVVRTEHNSSTDLVTSGDWHAVEIGLPPTSSDDMFYHDDQGYGRLLLHSATAGSH